jgi:hypothetical protein
MQETPLERVPDQLLTPMLAFLKVAVNASVGLIMLGASGDSVPPVGETLGRPQSLTVDPGNTPRLSCYRVRSKPKRTGFGRIDHIATLQFDYVSPSCGAEQLEERWPLLDRVWCEALSALDAGVHPDWEDGASVHERAGIVWLDIASAEKQEFYVDGDGFTYPGFRAQLQVTWRPVSPDVELPTYPALSFTSKLYVDGNDKHPDVVATGYTELGQLERDTDTIEETGEAVL